MVIAISLQAGVNCVHQPRGPSCDPLLRVVCLIFSGLIQEMHFLEYTERVHDLFMMFLDGIVLFVRRTIVHTGPQPPIIQKIIPLNYPPVN